MLTSSKYDIRLLFTLIGCHQIIVPGCSMSDKALRLPFIVARSFLTYMGRVDKGINCSVQGCDQSAQRSMSGSKARMASDLVVDSAKRVYLCKTHYKEWKKATKEDRENERARWQ
jgi:hypothetical protein